MTRLFVLFTLSTGLTLAQPDWEKASREIVRLPPSAFPELPSNLAQELTRRGCTIPQSPPQSPEVQGRHNVIRGHFARPDQTDWAVLCSVGRKSTILVFWNGSPANPASLESRPDADRLQGWGGDKIIFSWQIAPVDRAYILEHYRAYGGPKPPPIDHQGIDDRFVGKASVVLYFFNGKWLHLTGAD